MKYNADQCHVHRTNYLYILLVMGEFLLAGDRGVGSPKGGGREGRWSPGKVLGFSCILDTFYDNLKATDLVYFIS
jgi:hypothetical protein